MNKKIFFTLIAALLFGITVKCTDGEMNATVNATNTPDIKDRLERAGQEDARALYDLGISYKLDGDDANAVRCFRKVAEQGYANAQCQLGFHYENGLGVPKDYNEAVKWYRKAADQGNASAQFNLGLCYRLGNGVTSDQAEAVNWFRKAADQDYAPARDYLKKLSSASGNSPQDKSGVLPPRAINKVSDEIANSQSPDLRAIFEGASNRDAKAECLLGDRYYEGNGVPKDYASAMNWYRTSAAQGYADAQNKLGLCCYNGIGIPENRDVAFKWFRQAAEQGNSKAQINLGFCYYYGRGVQQDYTNAAIWFRKAAELGNDDAQCDLGMCYYYGRGVPQDYTNAVYWHRKAAEQDNAGAKDWLNNLSP